MARVWGARESHRATQEQSWDTWPSEHLSLFQHVQMDPRGTSVREISLELLCRPPKASLGHPRTAEATPEFPAHLPAIARPNPRDEKTGNTALAPHTQRTLANTESWELATACMGTAGGQLEEQVLLQLRPKPSFTPSEKVKTLKAT